MGTGDGLPSNVMAERAFLSLLMRERDAIESFSGRLTPAYFYRYEYRLIYTAMLRLSAKGDAVELVNIVQMLDDNGKLKDAGGIATITDVQQYEMQIPTLNREERLSFLESYAEIITRAYKSREGFKLLRTAALQAKDDDDLNKILETVYSQIEALYTDAVSDDPVPAVQAMLEWLEKKFEQSKRIQSVYGNYQKFSVAVEMAVRLRRNADIIEEDERRKYHIILGYYNLQELIEEVYQAYPKLRKAEIISLEWSQRVLKSWFAYCQSIGRNRYKISVNRLMSSPEISRETIKYLLYHELLHANGLWSHDKEFRQAEWQYPDSDRWDSELDSLYEQYKLDFSALKKEFNEKKTHEKVFVFTGRRKGESKPSPVVVIGNETEPTTFEDEPATKKPDGIMEGFKYCRNCGRKLRTDANFCNKCGRPVKY